MMPTMKTCGRARRPSAAPSRSIPSCAAAANIAGTPSRNEKRAAASRSRPKARPVVIVAPERDTPGIERQRLRDAQRERLARRQILGLPRAAVPSRSATSSATPTTASVTTITFGVRSVSSRSASDEPRSATSGIVPTTTSQREASRVHRATG